MWGRSRRVWLAAVALVALVALPGQTPAAETRQICVTFGLGSTYADASPRRNGIWIPGQPSKDAGETYGRTDQPFPAIAMLARVRDASGVVWGWAPLDEHGCTGEFETPTNSVTLEYYDWAYFADDTGVVAYDCWSGDGCSFEQADVEVTLETGVTHYELVHLKPTAPMFWATVFSTFRLSLVHGLPLYAVLTRDETGTRRNLGGWPTANYRGTIGDSRGTDHSKFTLAHEWGHIQTILATTDVLASDIDYGYTPSMCSDDPESENYQPGCTPSTQHAIDSLEYQSAASVEGFANWYAMSVWNDESQKQAVYIRPRSADTFLAIYYEGEYQPICAEDHCPQGVANALDWAFALWDLQARAQLPGVGPHAVGGLLAAAYPWPKPQDFWQHFLGTLPEPVAGAWSTIGGDFAIDN